MVTKSTPNTDQESVLVPPGEITAGVAVNVIVGGAMIVTVANANDVPPGPVAVRVYVVVCDSDTLVEPLAACAPMPLSIETEVEFVTSHVSVDDEPLTIEAGVAVNVMLGRLLTVTVAWLVSVPPGPFAVSVYVVVVIGLTVTEPATGLLPTLLSIVTEVALVVFQTSVDD
jgi:hypothetical protein